MAVCSQETHDFLLSRYNPKIAKQGNPTPSLDSPPVNTDDDICSDFHNLMAQRSIVHDINTKSLMVTSTADVKGHPLLKVEVLKTYREQTPENMFSHVTRQKSHRLDLTKQIVSYY